MELQSVLSNQRGIYPAGTSTVSFTFVVKNNGPERAGDVSINFTPPKGSYVLNNFVLFYKSNVYLVHRSFSGIIGDLNLQSLFVPATGDYVNNGFYKFKVNAGVNLPVGNTFSGTVTFNVLPDAPQQMQFKFSVTCSSIEKIFNNNYIIQSIYIDQ